MGVVPAAIVILPSLPYYTLQQTFLEHPPRVARRFAQVASWTFAYPIDENLHTHTHKQMRVGTRFGAYRWNMEISPFI